MHRKHVTDRVQTTSEKLVARFWYHEQHHSFDFHRNRAIYLEYSSVLMFYIIAQWSSDPDFYSRQLETCHKGHLKCNYSYFIMVIES